MYRILITDKLGQAGLDRLNEMADIEYDVKTGLSKEELLAIIPTYEALIVRSRTQPDADIITAGTRLKIIGRAGIGVDNIDLEAATQQGIIVMNTPHANSAATAEQTMALMLATSRHTARAHAALLAGKWERANHIGTELRNKILGIIGFGHIGRLVAQHARSFGMTVIAYDPYVSESVGRDSHVELVDLEDLLPQADYITLHPVVTPETTHIINAESLAKMKPTTVLINVARGKLVDEAALAAALQSGQIAAAGIDVYEQEPPHNSPLIGLPNVTHTPHLGASTHEAQRTVAVEIVEQVADGLRQTDYRNAVNAVFPSGVKFETIRPYVELADKIGRIQYHMSDADIHKVQVEVNGSALEDSVKLIASGLLKGMLMERIPEINEINAPLLAHKHQIAISQEYGIAQIDYSNQISCRAYWLDEQGEEQSRMVAGVLFGGSEPRIVQIDRYRLEAKPEGYVIAMRNKDTPGVIGQVATLLATYEVNIAEWRLGRDTPGGEALCFINVDKEPPAVVIDALSQAKSITKVKLIRL